MTETLTLSQLSSSLWKATWHLKGPVDGADFKTYIFPLLFFKRHSDVHDEEHEVQQALRRALLKYKLHTDQELFDKAYGYIRRYY